MQVTQTVGQQKTRKVIFRELPTPEITKNTIKFNSETVEVTRKGLVTGKLVFKKGKNNQSLYSTPFGDLLMEVYTKDILLEEKEDNIDLKIDYELYANNSKVSDSIININIRETV